MQASEKISSPQLIPVPPAASPDPLLNPHAEHFRLGRAIVGQVVTLGRRFQFFSDRADYADLDGLVFEDLETLRSAVRKAAAAVQAA